VLFNPLEGVGRATYIAFPLLQALGTWIVDLVLLLRVFAVFPFGSTRPGIFAGVFAFPLVIKITRFVLIITSITLWARTVKSIAIGTVTTSSTVDIVHSPLLKSEFVCELADHM
jgi:hypothetical protein